MNIVNRSRGLKRPLAFALAVVVAGCTQISARVGSLAATMNSQAQSVSTSKDRTASKKQQSDDTSFTRPRRTEQPDAAQSETANGPLIRVALMTDVSSVTLSSSSGLIVRRAIAKIDDRKNISTGPLTVELRQQREPVAHVYPNVVYRVSVGYSSDSRSARKLLDELKKKYFEPITMSFDEKHKEYAVLIGGFANRNEASQFLERLRKSGYESLRIVSESKIADTAPPDSLADTNARAEKNKAGPGYSTTARSSAKPDRRPFELIALAANKIITSSGDELVVSPVADRSSSGIDPPEKHAARQAYPESPETQSATASAPAAVSIGDKEYRGDIHLVLNPRGHINVVNALPLEEYLRGVVPLELSPGAYPEMEALKAQAVAARSYALAHRGQHRDEGFDLVDDTRAQVYGGLSAEREMTNRAIAETRGIAAVFPNEEGKLTPIDALYTANCGGRTENNDEVFGGKPLSYLRAVACALDQGPSSGSQIVSSRTREPLVGIDGRSISRDVALLSVIGFSLPRRVGNSYLSRPPEFDEIRGWIEQAVRLTQNDTPSFTHGDGTRLAEFARLIAAAVYGKGRATTLLAPADVDYLLSGLRVQQLPADARAEVAMLLKDGILRLPADAALDGRAQITRGQAIETLARAISTLPQAANPKAQPSDSKYQNPGLRSQLPDFKSETAVPSENGRLIIAQPASARDSSGRERAPRFTSVNTSAPGRLGRQQDDPTKSKSTGTKETTGDLSPGGLEISEGAWLFRTFGGESHQVERLTIIGGERVAYHLNSKGQVDFLEASISDRSASSDRFSSVAQWQERIPVEELQQRLARVRINVGRLEKIEPVAFSSSSRVTEVEFSGDQGSARLRRPQIRATLGLKEYLFVVDREIDARGQVIAFVFTGRGWGHGVGMCQTGAYGLAKAGYSYTAILEKYYTGVKLQKRY